MEEPFVVTRWKANSVETCTFEYANSSDVSSSNAEIYDQEVREFIFSFFFLGEKNGKAKRRWKAWNKMTVPMERGIGIMKLGEVQRSLFHKFGWPLLTQNSLWSNFFRAKYVKNKQLSLCLGRILGSSFWHKVVEGIPFILENSKWKVNEGDLSFWYDKFLDEGPLYDLEHQIEFLENRIKELLINDIWDIGKLQDMVGPQLVTKIMETTRNLSNKKDVLIWLPNKSGSFSTKSAWDILRVKSARNVWFRWVWNKLLPNKMSL